MTSEALTGSSLPYRLSGAADFLRWKTFFGPKSDITYRLIEDIEFDGIDLEQSLFSGTIFRDCRFINVNFTMSDLDGMRVERCSFTDCNLHNADVRSADFVQTGFTRTDLRGVYLTDCTFEGCTLVDTSFEETAVADCTFRACSLTACSMQDSTWTLNRFEEVAFTRMVLGDCTFLYAVMLRCRMTSVRINAESVGMIFGLTPDDLRSFAYMYLGEEQDAPDDLDVGHILEFYASRRWSIGIAILRLNARLTSVAFALREYFAELFALMEQGGPLRSDELRFVMDVLEQLRRDGRLPLMSVLELVEQVVRIGSSAQSTEPRVRAALHRIAGPGHLLLTEMLDELESRRLDFTPGSDASIQLRAEFHTRPEIPLVAVVNDAAAAAGLGSAPPARTLESGPGSYYEILLATVSTAAAAQMFLYLVAGCMVQITHIRAQMKVMREERLPAAYRGFAGEAVVPPPPVILDMIHAVRRFAVTVPWLQDAALGGYAPENVIGLSMLKQGGSAGPLFEEELEQP